MTGLVCKLLWVVCRVEARLVGRVQFPASASTHKDSPHHVLRLFYVSAERQE